MNFEIRINNKHLFEFHNYCKTNNIDFDKIIENWVISIQPIFQTCNIDIIDNKLNILMDFVQKQINTIPTILSSSIDTEHLQNTLTNSLNQSISTNLNNYQTNNNLLSQNLYQNLTTQISNANKQLSSDIVNNLTNLNNNGIEQQLNALNTILTNLSTTTSNNFNSNNGLYQELNKNINSIQHNLNNMMNKISVSSTKGAISENILLNILTNMFPTSEIKYVSETKETGDIVVSKMNNNQQMNILVAVSYTHLRAHET
jgi:DNA anti-recombination protein RmuC